MSKAFCDIRIYIVIFLLGLLTSHLAAQANPSPVWPMTGHDAQRTGRSAFVGPSTAPSGPSWTATTGAPIIGDLAISAEGIIYFTSDRLYALNPDGTPFAPPVALAPLTSPAIDDLNGFLYVIVLNSVSGYDVLRFSKQLQNQATVYHGLFSFSTPTSITIGPDGTLYFADGVSLIAVGPQTWRSIERPCFGNPGFLAPTLGRDGSVYSMCQPGGGSGSGSGIYRFDGNTGAQIGFAGYTRGGTELLIDQQNDIRAGFQAFNGVVFGGSYDTWDVNLNQLTPANQGDFTTSRSSLLPDGSSTVRIGFSFQNNLLEASGAHTWGVFSGILPLFSTVPTVDASGNIFIGTVSGVAALSQIDGSTIWVAPLADNITTQPALDATGNLFVGASSGKIYALKSLVPRPKLSTPASLDFGIATVGQQTNLALNATNAGTSSIIINNISIDNSAFSVAGGLILPATIAPNHTISFPIAFAPKSKGSFSGVVSIGSDAANSPTLVTIIGVGVLPPVLVISPPALDFGAVPVGLKQTLTLSITNMGDLELDLQNATFSGTSFQLVSPVAGQTIQSHQSISLTLLFAPQAVVPFSGTLTLVSNAINSPTTISLKGAGMLSRQAPFDQVSCDAVKSIGDSDATMRHNPTTGTFFLDIRSRRVGNVLAATGDGIIYAPGFTGSAIIRAIVTIQPPSFDLVAIAGLPFIDNIQTATISTDALVESNDGTVGLSLIRTAVIDSGQIVGIPTINVDKKTYNPAETFVVEVSIPVTAGVSRRICGGIVSKAITVGISKAHAVSKGLYSGRVLRIEVLPEQTP